MAQVKALASGSQSKVRHAGTCGGSPSVKENLSLYFTAGGNVAGKIRLCIIMSGALVLISLLVTFEETCCYHFVILCCYLQLLLGSVLQSSNKLWGRGLVSVYLYIFCTAYDSFSSAANLCEMITKRLFLMKGKTKEGDRLSLQNNFTGCEGYNVPIPQPWALLQALVVFHSMPQSNKAQGTKRFISNRNQKYFLIICL